MNLYRALMENGNAVSYRYGLRVENVSTAAACSNANCFKPLRCSTPRV